MRKRTDFEWAYFILRMALGMDLFGHGFIRVAGHYSDFHNAMVKEFSGSLLPEPLVSLFGWILPPAELLIGALLLLGFRTRVALLGTGALMVTLIFGSSLIQNWNAVAIQLLHAFVCSALLAFRSQNAISVDGLIRREK